jgi:hypothetical protein
MPAACYAGDPVAPVLVMRGDVAETFDFDVTCRATPLIGPSTATAHTVRLANGLRELPLFTGTADELAELTWDIAHEGISVLSGRIRVLRPPFSAVPARVEGENLFDAGGTQLVFVPHRQSGHYLQPAISLDQAFGHLVCVDDFLAAQGLPGSEGIVAFDRIVQRIVDGPDRPTVRHVSLPEWDDNTDGFGPLLKIVQVPAAIPRGTDVVVLSLGLKDMLFRQDTESFERQIAAVSDLVSASLEYPVIWVTPPPFPGDSADARAFAAAVRRVAEARGMPVADLYTAFLGMRSGSRPFFVKRGLALSDSGQNLAAQVIARALLQANRGHYR